MGADLVSSTECAITPEAVAASATNVIPGGSVVIASRVGLGKVCQVVNDTAINQDLRAILPKDAKQLDTRYLFWWLKSIAPKIVAAGNGATVQGVTLPFLKELPLPLPTVAEQQRIVAVLDEAFEGIATATANAKKNLANARELFTSELDAEFATAFSAAENVQLQRACERITVGHVGPMKTRYTEIGIPFLRSQNVRPFQISLEGLNFIDKAFDAELAKSRLRPGDVAVVRTGYPGTAAVIPDDMPVANCADLVIMRPGPSLRPHYLAAFLNSGIGKAAVAGQLVGAAQKHFNIGAARTTTIPMLTIEAQDALVARLDRARTLSKDMTKTYRRKIMLLTTLKQAMLERAFAGSLGQGQALAA